MLLDISPTMAPELAVWPGDVGVSRTVNGDIAEGDRTTCSSIQATVHLGSHADAPSHLETDGATIDRVNLGLYIGPCQVIRVDVPRGGAVTPDLIPDEIVAARVLVATGTYPDPRVFTQDFAGLSVELADWLHERGVILVGIDTPSVDPFSAASLPAHHRLLSHNIAILEGLRLEGVEVGEYELIAPPLKLGGFDASPVRAVLRRGN